MAFMQAGKERLRKYRITDPGRGYDEDFCHKEEG